MFKPRILILVLTLAILSNTTMRVQASLIGDIIGATAAQSRARQSLSYYDDKGRQEMFEEIKKQEGVNADPELNRILAQIMTRLSDVISQTDPQIKEKPYNYFVNNNKDFNAYCTLGNNITVNTGVFTFFDNNQDQVAAVVAHELAHGQRKHVINGAKKKITVDFIANILGSQANGVEILAVGLVAAHTKNTGITKPNEWDADNVSFDYMAKAGYNIGATAAVWQKVIDKGGKQSSNFFTNFLSPSTHPGNEARRDNYANKMYEYSNKKVLVDAKTGEVKINGKTFVIPTVQGSLSALERSYLVAGNLSIMYNENINVSDAYIENGVVKVAGRTIITPNIADVDANELVKIFNQIK